MLLKGFFVGRPFWLYIFDKLPTLVIIKSCCRFLCSICLWISTSQRIQSKQRSVKVLQPDFFFVPLGSCQDARVTRLDSIFRFLLPFYLVATEEKLLFTLRCDRRFTSIFFHSHSLYLLDYICHCFSFCVHNTTKYCNALVFGHTIRVNFLLFWCLSFTLSICACVVCWVFVG